MGTKPEDGLEQAAGNCTPDQEPELKITSLKSFWREMGYSHEQDDDAAHHPNQIGDTTRNGRRQQSERHPSDRKRACAENNCCFRASHQDSVARQ